MSLLPHARCHAARRRPPPPRRTRPTRWLPGRSPPLDEQLGPLVPQSGRVGRQQQRQLHGPQGHVRPFGPGGGQARTLFRIRCTRPSGSAGLSIDGSSEPPVAPATSNSASPPLNTRPPSNGSASTCSSGGPNPTTKCPGSATPYTGAPARRATSIHTTDSRIGSPCAAGAPRAAARTPAADSRPAFPGTRSGRPVAPATTPPTTAGPRAGTATARPAGRVRSGPRRFRCRRAPRPPAPRRAGTARTDPAARTAPLRRTASGARRNVRAGAGAETGTHSWLVPFRGDRYYRASPETSGSR